MITRKDIEVIYTGGGIYVAQAHHEADSNIVFNIDSTMPGCLNKYNMEEQADRYEWLEDNLLLSLDMSSDREIEQAIKNEDIGIYECKIYQELYKALKEEMDLSR